MNIAVIGCKAKKQDYACSAEEMYMPSYVYRAQLAFVKQTYDYYYILSSQYGLLNPNTIIEPYNTTLYSKMDIKTTPQLEEQNKFWQYVNMQLRNLTGEIHFHTSKKYTEGITCNIRHIKQQVAFGQIKEAYTEALDMYTGNNLEECLTYLQEKKISKYNEQAKWFYHPTMGKFYGKATQLKKQFPDYIDEGNAYQLSTGRIKQHKGWTI